MNKVEIRLRNRQVLTVALMFLGYSGYYLCRSNFSVALTSIQDELVAGGLSRDQAKLGLGAITSMGILAYALGKPFAGPLADFLGGRRNYLVGMVGAILMTLAFGASGGLSAFGLIWFGNRFVQSFGWAGMIKITSRWFGYTRYGSVMGVISLSYLFGDAAARAFMGRLLHLGLGWRSVFFVAAGVLAAIFVLNVWLLRESPKQLGLPEPETNPENVFGYEGADPNPTGVGDLLKPLLRSPAFWLVCLLSLGLTLLRETFNTWTPTYLEEGVGLDKASAASASALFPFFGGISVVLAGYLGDRLGRGGRALVILAGMVLAGMTLAVLGYVDFHGSTRWPIVLVSTVGFFLIGPYSYLAGAIALDLGGKHGSATASGFIDFAGYLGGVLAGWGLARLTMSVGWRGTFVVLAGVAWLSSALAAVYYWEQRRRAGTPASVVEGDL